MRHRITLKAILCVPLLAAPYVLADESADRVAIGVAIAGLNEVARGSPPFAEGADTSELDRLRKIKRFPVELEPITTDSRGVSGPPVPTVTISHEPWGEATINFPGTQPPLALEILNPRIVCRVIRFIMPDVALADGAWTYVGRDATMEKPLLFVMRREGNTWRIASLRILAAP
jgi:hypothetical protein